MGLTKGCFDFLFDEIRKRSVAAFVLPGTVVYVEDAREQGLPTGSALNTYGDLASFQRADEGVAAVFDFLLLVFLFVSHKGTSLKVRGPRPNSIPNKIRFFHCNMVFKILAKNVKNHRNWHSCHFTANLL